MQWELLILPGKDEIPGWGRETEVWTVTMPYGALARSRWLFWDGWGRGAAQSQLEFASIFPLSCRESNQGMAEPGKKSLAWQEISISMEMLAAGFFQARPGSGRAPGAEPKPEPGFAAICRPASSEGNPDHWFSQLGDVPVIQQTLKPALSPFQKGGV